MRMYDYLTRYDRQTSGPGADSSCTSLPGYRDFLLSEVGRGKRILDVGCMEGRLSRLLIEQFNEVWGVELNAEAAEVAAKRGVKVKIANIEEGLPFEDSCFDIVHAGEIIEQLFDTKSFFLECHRVLKKDGFVIFTIPNLNSLENRLKVLAGGYLANVGAYPEDHFGRHIRIFNLPKIRELCSQTGFEIETVRGVFSLKGSEGAPGDAVWRGLIRWALSSNPLSGRLKKASAWAASRFAPGFSKVIIFKARRMTIV